MSGSPISRSAFIKAAENGDVSQVQQALQEGASAMTKGCFGNSALHEAANNGHVVVVRVLLEADADPNDQNYLGETALHLATSQGRGEVVEALLQHRGTKCNITDKHGKTALHNVREHMDLARVLLCGGADFEGWKGSLEEHQLLHELCRHHPDLVFPRLPQRLMLARVRERLPEGTWLHVAVAARAAEACKALVQAKALPRARNSQRETPLDVAKKEGCQEIVDFLSQFEVMDTTCIGSGEACLDAIKDESPVVKVEWFSFRLPGRLCIHHSLLLLTLQDPQDPNGAQYVLEKAKRHEPESMTTEKYKNGVHLSLWDEVRSRLREYPKAYQSLSLEQLERPNITMKECWQTAVDTGPYNLGRSNCHHASRAVFNFCATRRFQVPRWRMPNRLLTLGARFVGMLGVNLEDRGWALSGSRQTTYLSTSGTVASAAHYNLRGLYHSTSIEMVDNCPGEVHADAVPAAELSAWIYTATPQTEPLPIQGSLLFAQAVTGAQEPVQWALVSDDPFPEQMAEESPSEGSADATTVYLAFKGTDNPRDVFIDIAAQTETVTYDGAELQVHGGMWRALQQGKVVEKLLSNLPSKADTLVVCGHSLGGGYAVLTGLMLLGLDTRPDLDLKVITFGAPQVLRQAGPDAHPYMKDLHSICQHYVHRWDVVPRLPSLWMNEVMIGHVRVELEHSPKRTRLFEKYVHVGTLLFVVAEYRWARRVDTDEDDWRSILGQEAPSGVNVAADHAMGDCYLKVIRELNRDHQPPAP